MNGKRFSDLHSAGIRQCMSAGILHIRISLCHLLKRRHSIQASRKECQLMALLFEYCLPPALSGSAKLIQTLFILLQLGARIQIAQLLLIMHEACAHLIQL